MNPFIPILVGLILCAVALIPKSRAVRFLVMLPALATVAVMAYKVGGQVGRSTESSKFRYMRSLLFELDQLNESELKHEIHQLNHDNQSPTLDHELVERTYFRLVKLKEGEAGALRQDKHR